MVRIGYARDWPPIEMASTMSSSSTFDRLAVTNRKPSTGWNMIS
jgi:hypothetical protein